MIFQIENIFTNRVELRIQSFTPEKTVLPVFQRKTGSGTGGTSTGMKKKSPVPPVPPWSLTI
ncbi:MAG: hypothetical protein SPK26_14765 [Treponema sp.]|nr:hypothetical protein [Treponema sp.]MDY5819277.1 hypothetical protein [Treponema sp.]